MTGQKENDMSTMEGEAQKYLIGACEDLSWKEGSSAMRAILTNLSWWLDEIGAHIPAMNVAGKINEQDEMSDEWLQLDALLRAEDLADVDDLKSVFAEFQETKNRLDALLARQDCGDIEELEEMISHLKEEAARLRRSLE